MKQNIETITPEMQEVIKSKFFYKNKEHKICISLSSSRLDFKKTYYFDGFTKKGIGLYWLNGGNKDRVNVVAKVQYFPQYKDYALYTEGWQYIEHFKLEDRK